MEFIAEQLIASAVRAPSGHNTQPWQFSVERDTIRNDPDLSRRLSVVDPEAARGPHGPDPWTPTATADTAGLCGKAAASFAKTDRGWGDPTTIAERIDVLRVIR